MDPFTSSAISTVASSATANPVFQQNRARMAAVADLGYEWADAYDTWRGPLFILGLIGATASGWALTKRKGVREANVLYSLTGVGSLAMAWFTRPDFLRSAPPPSAAPVPGPGAGAALIGMLDKRVASLNASSPGWEAASLTRLANDLEGGKVDPAIAALLTANSH